ncbi:MAG: retroviral-like aspartic protease family protein [Candidatus Rokubacteria bacterium]|nr:retroviral-like aspartic protease family protein [Candidatus Rokubacteria bacterium]MBI2878669.1 retroviral-like aspartic protease family protein [Candidatus Rokubacteria bacterium]
MGLIYRVTHLRGDRGAREVKALFDTGASQCFVRRDIAQVVATPGRAPFSLAFETATGRVETDQVIFAAVAIDSHELFWTFMVIPELTEELILGADFFQRWKIRLDPEQESVSMDPGALRLKLV